MYGDIRALGDIEFKELIRIHKSAFDSTLSQWVDFDIVQEECLRCGAMVSNPILHSVHHRRETR